MLAAAALALALATPEPPWVASFFAADPAEVARAAASLTAPKDVEIDLLFVQTTVSFDEAGRQEWTERIVFVPRSRGGVERWGTFSIGFNPAFQARPEIRARVVSPGGKETRLDPATVVEGGFDRSADGQYGDHRLVHAPLPGLEVGAVVEEEVVLREVAPFFTTGVSLRLAENRPVPVRALRLRVEARAGMPLRATARNLPAPSEELRDGRRSFTLAADGLPAVQSGEPGLPPDLIPSRHLDVSTAASWGAVASAYSAMVWGPAEGADLAATAREIVKKGDSAAVASQKVLDWIGARVRYTGLTLDQTGLVPAAPGETLQRRFGDCKDLSLLAAALLRAAGYRAEIAVLRTSDDEPNPLHPGMGIFDHAVVRVEARPPVWLDPAAGMPAGALGPASQGRLALVAARGTSGLVRTPEAGPEASRVTRVRRLDLAEYGLGHAVEENRYEGVAGALVGASLRGEGAEEGEKTARRRLRAPDSAAVSRAFEPGEGRSPPAWRAEADASQLAVTSGDEARALASPEPVFSYMPSPFRTAPLQHGEVDAPLEPRTAPMRIPVPYQTELRYEIRPPPGFRPASLPPTDGFTVGSTSYAARSEAAADGTVTVRYSFTLGRYLLPVEVDRLWRAVAQRTAKDGPWVTFERISSALLTQGKGREALDEIRRLTALHPTEARHWNHLALALLDLHMGEAARAAARRAVALEPENEWSYRVLATALRCDLLGRRLAPGADVAGAEAAARTAVKLAPRLLAPRGLLAELLLVDARGERVRPGPRLDEALSLLRTMREEEPGDHNFDEAWIEALFAAGRFREAGEAARLAAPSPRRNVLLLAAAMGERSEAIPEAVGALEEKARDSAFQGAITSLMQARHYSAFENLAQLLESKGQPPAGFLVTLRKLARVRPGDDRPLDARDPATLPARLTRAVLAPDPLAALAAVGRRGMFVNAEDADLVTSMGTAAALGEGQEGVGLSAMLDVALALTSPSVEGDGPWRVTLNLPDFPWVKGAARNRTPRFYAIREDGQARLAAAADAPGTIARLAVEAWRAGDRVGARRIVGWAREALPADPGAGRGLGLVAKALWPERGEPTDDELIRFASALAAFAPDDVRPPVPLELARLREGTTGPVRAALALAEQVAAGADDERVLRLAPEVAAGGPELEAASWPRRMAALRGTGRKAEAGRLAEERLAAHAGDLVVLRELVDAAYEDGEVERARGFEARLLALDGAWPGDANNAAWRRLFFPPLDAQALENARGVQKKTDGTRDAVIHTVATLEAFLGRPPAEAMSTLLEAVRVRGGRVSAEDWLVVGRVAEAYGLPQEAAEAYRRVSKPSKVRFDSSWVLAQRRLEALAAAGKGEGR